MPCGGCGYTRRLPYDSKREMRNRRSYRRRMRHAKNTKNWTLLSKEGHERSICMGGAYEEGTAQ